MLSDSPGREDHPKVIDLSIFLSEGYNPLPLILRAPQEILAHP